MPVYQMLCTSGHVFETPMTFSRHDAIVAGTEGVLCSHEECGEPAQIQFNPGSVSFSLKEGETGGWVSKSLRENKYRNWRGTEMARRSREHIRPVNLVPNYQGVVGEKWKDVQDHVHSKEGPAAASTYNSLVAKEST